MRKLLNFIVISSCIFTGANFSWAAATSEKAVPSESAKDGAATEDVAATVNGEKILRSEILAILKEKGGDIKKEDQEKLYNVLLNELILINLVMQEATKAKIEETPQYKKIISEMKKDLLPKIFMDTKKQEIIKKIENNPDLIAKKIEELKEKGGKQVRFKHMTVKGKELAERILKSLKNGKKFDEIAREKSLTKDKIDTKLMPDSTLTPELKTIPLNGTKVIPVKDGHFVIFKKVEEQPLNDATLLEQLAQSAIFDDETKKFFEEIRAKSDIKKRDIDGNPIEK